MDADPRDAIIEQLRADNARLARENQELHELIGKLQDQMEELERKSKRQAAPFRREEKDRKPPDQHGSCGRRKGHPPAHRQEPGEVDDDIEVQLTACPHCGGPVTDVQACEQYIEDLPARGPYVTRLVTYSGRCHSCGRVRSTHPIQVSRATGAAKVHLGARALALGGFLNKHLGLTLRSSCRVLEELAGLRITPGGLIQGLHRLAEKASESFEHLQVGLRSQPVVYADETSWWLGGQACWLWGFTTPDRTVYRVEGGRGRDVVLDTLGTRFGGVLVSDCLSSYENLPYTMQKCYAHHLKAIGQARDRKPVDQRAFFDDLAMLLGSAMMLARLRSNLPPPAFVQARQGLEQRAAVLLLPHRADPDEERVVNRLRKRRQWLFTFLDHPQVEATNNRAERALRPAVIARKLSCGNKTQRGKRTWEILASLAATCHQRGTDFVDYLRPLLTLAPTAQAR
jgi:hypothetical protein